MNARKAVAKLRSTLRLLFWIWVLYRSWENFHSHFPFFQVPEKYQDLAEFLNPFQEVNVHFPILVALAFLAWA